MPISISVAGAAVPETYSTTFHELAKAAAARAEAEGSSGTVYVETASRRHYSVAAAEAVLLAVAALEAGANEMASAAGLWLNIAFPTAYQHWSLRRKWQALPGLLKGRSFEEKREPWLGLQALISLRNALVHFKWLRRAPDVRTYLEPKELLLSHPSGVRIGWPSAALTNVVAVWAVNTVADTYREAHGLCGETVTPAGDFWIWTPQGFPRIRANAGQAG